MAKNVKINSVIYAEVPQVSIPLAEGEGTAVFYDTTGATAASGDILTGKSAFIGNGFVAGSMSNNGAVSGSISKADGTYTIPAGFHNGKGAVRISSEEQAKLVSGNIKARDHPRRVRQIQCRRYGRCHSGSRHHHQRQDGLRQWHQSDREPDNRDRIPGQPDQGADGRVKGMKVDVKIAGASYSEVPAVLLPLKNGGRARFCEVSDTTAEASDVALGKRFYTSEGELVVGTAELSQGADTRKKITLIQKEHQNLTVSCNHPDLSSQTDLEGNTIYATEYQDALDISLKADADYYAGKITINGAEQESTGSNRQNAFASVSISNGMVVSATDAIPIPTVPFTDVSLTLTGQGTQWLMGYLLATTKQSPETPKIGGALLAGNDSDKGILFLVEGEQRYAGCQVELTTGTGITDSAELSYEKDTDLGVTMMGKISDALYAYLKESAESKTEVTLTIKVVG